MGFVPPSRAHRCLQARTSIQGGIKSKPPFEFFCSRCTLHRQTLRVGADFQWIMEDVEQRRQRLAAMREEATLQTDGGSLRSLTPLVAPLLPSNPLENTPDTVETAGLVKDSGFDFYTDPLAGFSGSKRRKLGLGVLRVPSDASQPSNAAPHLHPDILSHHLQTIAMHPPLAPPAWQPVPYQPPPPFVPGFIHPQTYAHYHPQPVPHYMNQFPDQAFGRERDNRRGGRDGGRTSPSGPVGIRGFGTGGTVYPPNGPGGGGRGYIAPIDRGGRVNSWAGRSPGNSRGPGNRSVGTWQKGGRTASAVELPNLFFKKSMVEDPWQHLEASSV